MQKYRILKNRFLLIKGQLCYRIQALSNFRQGVKKGDLGGFVTDYRNLSQYGTCWIFDDAKAIDYSIVKHNAELRNNAVASDYSVIQDNAVLRDNSKCHDYSVVKEKALVC